MTTRKFTDEQLHQLQDAIMGAAADWAADLQQVDDDQAPDPDPDPDEPAVDYRPTAAAAKAGPGSITLTWSPPVVPVAATVTGYRYGRDGVDQGGAGPWSGDLPADARTATLDKLTPGSTYKVTVTALYAAPVASETGVTLTAIPAEVPVPPTDPGKPGAVTWSSGAYVGNSQDTLKQFGTMRGRRMAHASVFTSRESADAILRPWWLTAGPKDAELSVGMPMCPTGSSVAEDISPQIRQVAALMKADGRKFWIRLGWEMNLPQWAWRVTDANLSTWRARWSTYYDIFKAALGDKGQVGFNPNVGGNQSGLSGSILRAWVDGKVDWAGPDAYDCWPPFTSDAAVKEQFGRDQGLDWWAKTCRAKKVPLGVPEWGVASGTQWAGHQGGDNARYITEMFRYFTREADNLALESYFDEPDGYLKSDLISQNRKAGAEYARLYRTTTTA